VPRYKRVRSQGFTFLFAYDEADPTLLHIYARHLTTIEDALRVWLDQHHTVEIWNEQNERFETRSESHVPSWTWLDDGETVLIISCFPRED
jgi:hypothetical protein